MFHNKQTNKIRSIDKRLYKNVANHTKINLQQRPPNPLEIHSKNIEQSKLIKSNDSIKYLNQSEIYINFVFYTITTTTTKIIFSQI